MRFETRRRMTFCLNILFIFLGCVVSTWLHELGHFIASRSVGVYPTEVHFGIGKILFQVQFINVQWIFKRNPFGGFTGLTIQRMMKKHGRKILVWTISRKKIFWIASSGLFTNVLLTVTCMSIAFCTTGAMSAVLMAIGWFNLFLFLSNAIPSDDGGDGYESLKMLVRKTKARAFNETYRRYYPKIYRVILDVCVIGGLYQIWHLF